jgi:AraC-like DNA-binding protein
MQASTLTNPTVNSSCEHSDRELAERLQKSEIYREYQRAFEAATGLPLSLKAAGSFQAPSHGSRHSNEFCLLMAAQNKSCSSCLEMQQRIEERACEKAATLECASGMCESAVPVILRNLKQRGVDVDTKPLKEAYFRTQVVTRQRHESAVSLLSIFAMHLSSLSNQVMVSEASSESHTIAKARAFIAEHIGDEISLGQVARAAGMSVYYFCKIFKKEKGVTFTEYLARLRVEAVKQMLLNPHKRISEAAYDAGFQSLSQFNRVFRHFAGETPSNYRDNLHRTGSGLAAHNSLTWAA